jgi:hypothetical protein
MTVEVTIKFLVFEIISLVHPILIQHQEDLINTQDNLPLIQEAMECEPCGSRTIRILIN